MEWQQVHHEIRRTGDGRQERRERDLCCKSYSNSAVPEADWECCLLPYRIRQSHVEDGLQRVAYQLTVFMRNLAIVTRRAAQDVLQLGQTGTVLQQTECVMCTYLFQSAGQPKSGNLRSSSSEQRRFLSSCQSARQADQLAICQREYSWCDDPEFLDDFHVVSNQLAFGFVQQ